VSPELPPPRLGGRLVLKALLGGLLILCLTSAAVASAVLLQVDGLGDGLRRTPPAVFEPGVISEAEPGEPQTLLVVGSDRRYGAERKDIRSDTLMLIRLDPRQEATAVLNVPRDLAVEIPGYGRRKINEAYRFGGLSLVTRTVKATLGLEKIHHAMAVDFKGFRRVVNTLGCIYTDVDRRYFNDNTGPSPTTRSSTSSRATSACAASGRWSTCATATPTPTSCAPRASRRSCATPRTRSDELADLQLRRADRHLRRSTQTDPSLQQNKQVLRLLEQAGLSAGKPVRQVRFQADIQEDDTTYLGAYVTASDEALTRARERFLAATRERQRLVRPPAVKNGAQKARRGGRTTLEDFGWSTPGARGRTSSRRWRRRGRSASPSTSRRG
jgi:hypothetical protein